jgi:hypothetical protein
LDAPRLTPVEEPVVEAVPIRTVDAPAHQNVQLASAISGLRYNIEIHLPATKDPEVFSAIFRSLKEHLLDD